MLLTFGLLSPDKGIEHVIDALPAILARYPETVYIVLGATHPHVKERHGETYRESLERRVRSVGVDANMIFHNRFVSRGELAEFLAAADIYVTPVPQAGADHVRDTGLRGRFGQSGHLHAVSLRARTPRRRARHTRAVERPAGDRPRRRRSPRQ